MPQTVQQWCAISAVIAFLLTATLVPLQAVVSTNSFSETEPITRITWQSESNVTYFVQWSTNLADEIWMDLCEPVIGNGEVIFVYDEAHDAPQKTYRVVKMEEE